MEPKAVMQKGSGTLQPTLPFGGEAGPIASMFIRKGVVKAFFLSLKQVLTRYICRQAYPQTEDRGGQPSRSVGHIPLSFTPQLLTVRDMSMYTAGCDWCHMAGGTLWSPSKDERPGVGGLTGQKAGELGTGTL